ncbi:MAG TPA: DUF2085 domain-containing protein [Chloroflexota bacterium]|nr:DUF2085 domain-containing protein [Chloroflexota bacterium]
MRALTAHWLVFTNLLAGLFIGLPFLAPLLLAAGQPGPANLIYTAYRAVCHQWAFRSYFLLGAQSTYARDDLTQLLGAQQAFSLLGTPELGYKVAFCERDVAIYLAVLLGGLAYAMLRPRVGPLSLIGYLALIAPMALDGFTQLFGLRESTVLLRTVTGGLFGLASVWLVYPRIDAVVPSPHSPSPTFGGGGALPLPQAWERGSG